MTVVHSVAEVLAEHVELEVECIDRMYLNEYVPQLQYDKGLVGFFRFHRGHTFASSGLMKPISDRFVAQLKRFAAEQEVPLIRFEKGQRKDDVARAYLAGFDSQEGVLFIGKAQEKTRAFRTEGRRHRVSRERYAWIVPSTAIARHAGCDPGRRHELSSVRTQRETARAR